MSQHLCVIPRLTPLVFTNGHFAVWATVTAEHPIRRAYRIVHPRLGLPLSPNGGYRTHATASAEAVRCWLALSADCRRAFAEGNRRDIHRAVSSGDWRAVYRMRRTEEVQVADCSPPWPEAERSG